MVYYGSDDSVIYDAFVFEMVISYDAVFFVIFFCHQYLPDASFGPYYTFISAEIGIFCDDTDDIFCGDV